jgi:hypothetical protein
MPLVCNCCGQPNIPNKSRQDQIEPLIYAAEEYATCPLCNQAVPYDVLRNEGYKKRCNQETARLKSPLESEGKTNAHEVEREAEPTYEELKAQIAALESKKQRGSSISFKVSDKGSVSVYGLGRFPVTLYYEQWIRLLDKAQELREFLDQNKRKLKLRNLRSHAPVPPQCLSPL